MKIKELKKQVNNYTSSSFDIPFEYEKIKDYAYNKEFNHIKIKEKKKINLKVVIPTLSLSFVSVILLLLLIIMIPSPFKKSYEAERPNMSEGINYYGIESIIQGKVNRSNYDMTLMEPTSDTTLSEEVLTYEVNYKNESYFYLVFTNINDISKVTIDNINLSNDISSKEVTKVDNYYVIYWYHDSLLNVLYSKTNNIDDFLNVYNEMK